MKYVSFLPLPTLVLLFLAALPMGALAQGSPSARARLEQGVNDLKYYDVGEALRRWFENSPMAADTKGQALVQAELERALVSYGRIEGSEILGELELGEKTQRFYFTLLCERGPIYCSADAYLSKRGWLLTDFQFNTKAGKILPEALLEP